MHTVHKLLTWIEEVLYTLVGLILGGGAAMLMVWSMIDQGLLIVQGDVVVAILGMLDRLLLVVMLLEILHTVRISLEDNVFLIEPFMAVAIIAIIRKMLVVIMEKSVPGPEKVEEIGPALIELGVMTAIILVLVGCIVLVRRFPKPSYGVHEHEERKEPSEKEATIGIGKDGKGVEHIGEEVA
jgi:uncharacterized membrane protein (DUF373 family)